MRSAYCALQAIAAQRSVDRGVVAGRGQRHRVERQAQFDGEPSDIEHVQQRYAGLCEPHRQTGRADSTGWQARREAGR